MRNNLGMKLFFSDNPNLLSCGKIPDVYATVGFGVGIDPVWAFAQQRKIDPTAPLVNTEFYLGWLDQWSVPHQTVATSLITEKLDQMLSINASVNLYMFHGGTNFGFTSGANGDENYFSPQPGLEKITLGNPLACAEMMVT